VSQFLIVSHFRIASSNSLCMENQSAQKSVLSQGFILLRCRLLQVLIIQSELAIRQKLESTKSFLVVSPFLIASRDYLHMENWSAQKSAQLRVFILLRSLWLWIPTVISNLFFQRTEKEEDLKRNLDKQEKRAAQLKERVKALKKDGDGGNEDDNLFDEEEGNEWERKKEEKSVFLKGWFTIICFFKKIL